MDYQGMPIDATVRLQQEVSYPAAEVVPGPFQVDAESRGRMLPAGDQFDDQFRRILQVSIHCDHHFSARMLEPGVQGRRLTKVPVKPYSLNPWIIFGNLTHYFP